MRAAVFAAGSLALVGCSIFFDPGKAPVGCREDLCEARPNAIARCAGNACVYSCVLGRTDPNGDLSAAKTSNGCEGCAPAATPAELHAVVGVPSGGIRWEWAQPSGAVDGGTSNPVGFTLCTGAMPTALGSCQTMDASVACALGECGVQTLGHTNDLRVYARLQATDVCGTTTADGPTQSASPIDGTLQSLQPNNALGDWACDAGVRIDGGALKIEHPGNCLSALTFGDDRWQDFTLTAQIQLQDTPAGAGFAFHYPSGAQKSRSSLMLTPSTTETESPVALTTVPVGQTSDRVAATSIATVTPGQWLDVEVVSKGGEVVASVGALGSAKPVLRWHEPSPALQGRFGVFLQTYFGGREAEFRNVQVSTRAVLPDRGPTTVKPTFAGGQFPPEARVIPLVNAAPNVVMTNCLNGLEGTGCAPGACKPLATSTCLQINQGPIFRRSVTFDQPIGLDTKQPWRISFKFLAMTPNDNLAPILRTQVGAPIVRGPVGTWPGVLSLFGAPSNGTIEVMKWNKIDLTFTATTYEASLNGKKLTGLGGLFPPPGWDAHLGAVTFGGPDGLVAAFGQGNVQGQWTELEIAQPP